MKVEAMMEILMKMDFKMAERLEVEMVLQRRSRQEGGGGGGGGGGGDNDANGV